MALRLDLGCGRNPRSGYIGVDLRDYGQTVVADLRAPWPWADDSVEDVHCSHFLEHLTAVERMHFVNELYRVLVPGGSCRLIVPHWASAIAYGDLTHQWPPVSEYWFFYLSKSWRERNAAHNDIYQCDFDTQWTYSLHQNIVQQSPDYQQHAALFWKEACQEIIATLVARK